MSNTDSVTLFQTQLVKIESDVLGQEKDDTVVLPLAFPFGDDWKYLNAEKFMVDYADIMIAPYYDQATLINKNAGEGVVTGNFPVYMSIYAGNTMNENETLELSQMIYSGVYVTGSQNSTTKVELKGTVFKTLVDEVEKIKDKQNELHKMMDSSLLKNELVKLQLGRVAIGIRKSDFIASANSKNAENSTQVYNRMMAVHRKKLLLLIILVVKLIRSVLDMLLETSLLSLWNMKKMVNSIQLTMNVDQTYHIILKSLMISVLQE